jgi:pyruvate/2-oxoglutarate dehydrogenase complex dihydrolipoamide dehydrogenase (E3) component
MSDRDVEDVDLLVIAGGKAGKSLAMDRAKAGWKVAMVERDKIGGTCINVACIPMKALVGSARTVLTARYAEVMGVELGDRPLGTQVTLLQGPDQLLPREDSDVAAEVAEILANQGVGLQLGTQAQAVHREAKNGDVVVVLEDGSQVRGEELLVATGRAPVTAHLALESAYARRTSVPAGPRRCPRPSHHGGKGSTCSLMHSTMSSRLMARCLPPRYQAGEVTVI